MSVSFKVVIPVRYDSVRFPGKPLADIHGKPMIQHVHDIARSSGAEQVIIATDSMKIGMIAEDFGATVCMTRDDHPSGTDRIAEVIDKMGWDDETVVVNLQGDEPTMPAAMLRQVAQNLHDNPRASCATLYTPIADNDDVNDPNIVKVIFGNEGSALYFSRAVLPYQREQEDEPIPYFRHIGLYAYRASLLRKYSSLQPSYLEQQEKLEQLRLLANGFQVHVSEANELPGTGVDTPEDLEKVKQEMQASVEDAIHS